ncbi:NAD-dependent succinate-semialdehyde dehydrogenase (plasmid) [Cereibacter sphaeroides]|uniref:NAD-dependent succinate-semialdehyde dehydrogenase n=1 Tax=Cereibacter sphaeroides TaxID=1063 RepID=UPI000F53A412|nr:NAD-dependent succinate-semialdehyde dehydrogenase [Cereibacter sphaeroides]AZB66365.1 NAD-dependent succinate-semialdehyde dehydrogenase [Cereibacter sphaeroides]AZB71190.1 NAD-dependent succinate-semialdehyde dehydrogenase [Cereibacter sphaeroides]
MTDFRREKILVGGDWIQADAGGRIEVTNPATGAVIGTVPDAGAAETARAVAAAEAAFGAWRALTAAERATHLRRLAQAILDHREALAELLTEEQGKPLAEARGEVGMSAAYIQWFAEEARRVYGEVIPSPWPDRRLLVTRQPVGVVAAITPWNFPSSMLARKIGPALAAGCTVVAKPASQTPFSGLAWGVLGEMAGLPAGVLNIVTGSARAIGGELTANPSVRKITFTGSTPVGKVLLAQAAGTVKKMSMELGGNAPFLVFDDADLDRAVEGAIAAKFRNAGQTCVCTNRFYAQAGIHDEFVKRLAAATGALKVGPGAQDGSEIGPLIDAAAVAKTEEMVADATAKGGRIVTGGRRHAAGAGFYEPTVIADATDAMTFAREEIFGPVAPVFRFETEEEAIRRANATDYGLACYFYTSDLGRAFRVSEALDYGIVGVNEGLVTTEVAPFGGVKESGFGSEGSHHGMQDYLTLKYTAMGGLGR